MTLAVMCCRIFTPSRCCCCSTFYVRDGMRLTNALLTHATLSGDTCIWCLKCSVAASKLMSFLQLFFNDDSLCLDDLL